MSRLGRIVLRFASLTFFFLAGLLLVEGALRLVPAPSSAERTTKVVEIANTQPREPAFRDRQEPGTKGDRARVLVVGDSFTWGDGVYPQDAYPDRLEGLLNGLHESDWAEVVNWSRPGWNTAMEAAGTLAELPWLNPDLLVVGYCLNDAEPSPQAPRRERRRQLERRLPTSGASSWLYEHSALFHLAWERLENSRQHRAFDEFYRSLYQKRPSWTATIGAMKAFAKAAEERQIPLLMVIFPIFDSKLGSDYPYADLHELVAKTAGEAGFEVLDLLPHYQGIDPVRLAVEPFTDRHPSELAHRVAAERIRDLIVDEHLLSVPAGSPLD